MDSPLIAAIAMESARWDGRAVRFVRQQVRLETTERPIVINGQSMGVPAGLGPSPQGWIRAASM
jgi:hypothetical protein